MNANKVARDALIGVGAAIVLLPLVIVVVIGRFLFSRVAAYGIMAGAALAPLTDSAQRAIRNRLMRASLMLRSRSIGDAHALFTPIMRTSPWVLGFSKSKRR